MKLTEKEKRFVDEYLIDCNATRAAKAAGYRSRSGNEDTFRTRAAQILRKPKIRHAVDKELAKLSARTNVTAERVINELALLAFADIGDFVDIENHTIKSPSAASRKAMQSIKVRAEKDKDGDKVADIIEFRLYNKLDALDKLARHLNLFRELEPLESVIARLDKRLGEAITAALSQIANQGDSEEKQTK